jgi:hypothetical protein
MRRRENKKEEYDRKLNNAIENMNNKVWEEERKESQREREKDEYKDDLQNQIKDNMVRAQMEKQKKWDQDVEDERRVKREVFDLNNQYLVESGKEPLPVPKELWLPGEEGGEMMGSNILNPNQMDNSMAPSIQESNFMGKNINPPTNEPSMISQTYPSQIPQQFPPSQSPPPSYIQNPPQMPQHPQIPAPTLATPITQIQNQPPPPQYYQEPIHYQPAQPISQPPPSLPPAPAPSLPPAPLASNFIKPDYPELQGT